MSQSSIIPGRDAQSRVPLSLVYADDDPGFSVEGATASAALSENFRVVLRVKHMRSDLLTNLLVGRDATVTLESELDRPSFSGVTTSARFVGTVDSAGFYEIVLRPRTEWMTLRRDHRVLKDMTAVELAIELAKPLAARIGEMVVVGEPPLPTHEYRVQYGESDFAAMARLLADDGVSFMFDFWNDSRMIMVADTSSYALSERTLPFSPLGSLQTTGTPFVSAIAARSHQYVHSVHVRDAWMERPQFDASGYARLSEQEDIEHYAFAPSVENTEEELLRQAVLRVTEHLSPANVLELTTNAFLAPGSTLLISNAPTAPSEEKLLVVATSSRWAAGPAGASAMHTSICVPHARKWLPARPSKPVVAGLQKAFVVGDGEIDTDDFGRVLCCFDWDRGKLVSRRVEVSQAWAGPGYGLFTQPRVGDQVLVAYLDGDPDEPVVVGRVHNGKNRHPVTLPADSAISAWRTRSTPGGDGFNEILLDDNAKKERFAIHAQRDFNAVVEHDASWLVKHDYTVTVQGDHRQGVVGEFDTVVSGNTTFFGPSFSSTTQDLTMNSTNMTFTADTRTDRIYGTYRVDAGNETHTVRDTWSMTGPRFEVNATGVTITAGGASLVMSSGWIELKVGGSSITMMDGIIEIVSPLIDLNP